MYSTVHVIINLTLITDADTDTVIYSQFMQRTYTRLNNVLLPSHFC